MAHPEPYTCGVHQLSPGVFSYMQPEGTWGLNNTALLVDRDQSLLIDTVVDLGHCSRMLDAMVAATPQARQIGTIVLTHWHADHVHGICADQLKDSRVFASRICADFMQKLPPPAWVESIAALTGDAKRQMDAFLGGKFDFSGLYSRAPSDIFEGMVELQVGDRKVTIVETKPSHTRSDSVIHIPDEGIVHTGDLVSIDRHVSLQYPSINNLIDACELMISWHADTYIPGHGPLLDLQDMLWVRDYLLFLRDAARRCYDLGLPVEDALERILGNLGPYKSLKGPHGVYFSLSMIYCEFAGNTEEHARRNYPEHLAKQWHLRKTLPQRFPDLYGSRG